MRHITANIATSVTTDATTGSSASLRMIDTHPQSVVTRRIESPTDWRLWNRSDRRWRWLKRSVARSYTIRWPKPMLAYDDATPTAQASRKKTTVATTLHQMIPSRPALPGSMAARLAMTGDIG
jgi:hypothetical protein